MDRALREFRIRGVATNLAFLENLLEAPEFLRQPVHTKFIDETPELFEQVKPRRDRATKLLTYIADITVNGHPETAGPPRPRPMPRTAAPPPSRAEAPPTAPSSCWTSKGPGRRSPTG
jgi:pyruvate carboxylase